MITCIMKYVDYVYPQLVQIDRTEEPRGTSLVGIYNIYMIVSLHLYRREVAMQGCSLASLKSGICWRNGVFSSRCRSQGAILI